MPNDAMRALLISTYELGRQPFGLASPAAWLRQAVWTSTCVDARQHSSTRRRFAAADLVGVSSADAYCHPAGGAGDRAVRAR